MLLWDFWGVASRVIEGTLLGTPNREPQEYSRNITGRYLQGSSYSVIFLLYSWDSLFVLPSKVPLVIRTSNKVISSAYSCPQLHLWLFKNSKTGSVLRMECRRFRTSGLRSETIPKGPRTQIIGFLDPKYHSYYGTWA